ncbi:MAG: OmpA family protein [Propionibacteriaceae bacterium]|nr:OmpA family protein [Micropruina sp.]
MRSRSVLALLTGLLVLGGCTSGSNPLGGSNVEVSKDPAPSVTAAPVSMRADQIRRQGNAITLNVTVGLTAAASHDREFDPTLTTSGGQEIALDKAAGKRTMDADSLATATVSANLPDPKAKALRLKWNKAILEIPIPDGDKTVAWQPAPLRQAGLGPAISHAAHGSILVDTIRSQGMITEATYRLTTTNIPAVSMGGICDWNPERCTLTEADGTAHALIGAAPKITPQFANSVGSLRFMGALKPDATKLTLAVTGVIGDFTPIQMTLPTHADSLAVAAAGDTARPSKAFAPALTFGDSAAVTVSIDSVAVLSDHVQVHAVFTNASKSSEYLSGASDETYLAEGTQTTHRLLPAGTGLLAVRSGEPLDILLVFAGAIDPATTSLKATFKVGKPLVVDIPLNAIPAPSAPGAKLVDVEPSGNATPPPSVAVPSPSPSATTWTLSNVEITKAPTTGGAMVPMVRSALMGGTPSPATDPAGAVTVEKSLEELGAQRTPDGLVLTLPETVLFDYNSATLRSESSATITKVASVLNYFSTAQIGVQGHTDSTGAADKNQTLSEQRAQSVADALSKGGVTSSRMTVKGFGANNPIASNGDDAGRQKNRRVEIVLVQK